MPTYQYRCGQCGEQLEAWQSIHDDPLTAHEGCGGTLSKVFGVGGIVLKGSGFYRTDNRSKSSGGRKGDESSNAASGNGSSGDSKTTSDGGSKTTSERGSKAEPASTGASKAEASKS